MKNKCKVTDGGQKEIKNRCRKLRLQKKSVNSEESKGTHGQTRKGKRR